MDKYQDYVFKKIRKIHVFSDYQLAVARELFPDKRHFLIPLTLEDYGISKILPPDNTIRFLFFGYIKEYKGLDLLIQSFCDLRKSGYGNIELMVAGTCDNWPQYEKLINGDHAIKARIESIPNSEIPDVVCSCHYIVLPYRDSAQSGVLNISFQYNRPVIISDIDAFRNSVSDGTTGYFFKNGSQESLTEVMKKVIEGHPAKYQKMKENIKDYVQKKFAMDIILEKYRGLLDNCLS